MQGHEPKNPESTCLKGERQAEAAVMNTLGWEPRDRECSNHVPEAIAAVSTAQRLSLRLFKARCPSLVLSVESLIIPQSL